MEGDHGQRSIGFPQNLEDNTTEMDEEMRPKIPQLRQLRKDIKLVMPQEAWRVRGRPVDMIRLGQRSRVVQTTLNILLL